MAHLSDYNTRPRYQAKVRKTERLTPAYTDEVREILLEVQQPEFNAQVDQSFGVLAPAEDEFGNTEHHRLYSVADLPEKKNGKPLVTMLVKRCSYGYCLPHEDEHS